MYSNKNYLKWNKIGVSKVYEYIIWHCRSRCSKLGICTIFDPLQQTTRQKKRKKKKKDPMCKRSSLVEIYIGM